MLIKKFRNWIGILFLALLFLTSGVEVHAQDEYVVTPAEAEAGAAELQLVLTGPGLGSFGELQQVILTEVPLEYYFEIIDDEMFWIWVWIPEDTRGGEHRIIFDYQETDIVLPFFIYGPEPPPPPEPMPPSVLDNIFPREGVVDDEIELHLQGEGIVFAGEPAYVEINGVPIEFYDYFVENENEVGFWIYLPENLSTGEGEIYVEFEGAAYEEYFIVIPLFVPDEPREPTSTPEQGGENDEDEDDGGGGFDWRWFFGAVIAGGGAILLGGGVWVIRRLTRKPGTRPQEPQSEPPRPPDFHFRQHNDTGTQEIFPADRSISPPFEFRIETSVEHIDTSVDQSSSIVKDDETNAGGAQ